MISVCTVFKNEEDVLPLAIESWLVFADEIIYLDTGSTDSSLEIAQTAQRPGKDTVASLPWRNFTQAMNAAMDLATHEWVLRLDADELLVGDPIALRRWLKYIELLWKEGILARQGYETPQGVRPQVLMGHMQPKSSSSDEWKFSNYQSRCFHWRDGWRFRFVLDQHPELPGGWKTPHVLCPLQVANVYHLRSSIRKSSRNRSECYIWNRLLDGALPQDEIDHLDNSLTISMMVEEGEEGES